MQLNVKKELVFYSPIKSYVRWEAYLSYVFFGRGAARAFVVIEYCGVQAPNDKPLVESWFACYKREEVYRNDCWNFWESKIGFDASVDWYNYRRPHGSLGNVSPASFRAGGFRGTNAQIAAMERPETENVSTFQELFVSQKLGDLTAPCLTLT